MVDQHKAKGHVEIKFSENAITLYWVALETLNWCQKKQNYKVSICPKRTFCPILFRNEDIIKKLYFKSYVTLYCLAVSNMCSCELLSEHVPEKIKDKD